MRRIRGRDTGPEMRVRRFLHALGLRYSLHVRELPGRPDLVFRSRMTCIFVHGCFWHGCRKCVDGTRIVKSNEQYWSTKVRINQERDSRNIKRLRSNGWRVIVLWDCETTDRRKLEAVGSALKKRAHFAIARRSKGVSNNTTSRSLPRAGSTAARAT